MNMIHYFQVEVKAYIAFNDEQWAVIVDAVTHHYDLTVKGLGKPGGAVYGHTNGRNFDKELRGDKVEEYINDVMGCSSTELQLLMKAMEMSISPLKPEIDKYLFSVWKELVVLRAETNKNLHP